MIKTRQLLLLFIVVVMTTILMDETEARRKILRGRKTVNRHYMTPLGLPAWAIVLLIGIGQLIVGGLLYILCKWAILDKNLQPTYKRAATGEEKST